MSLIGSLEAIAVKGATVAGIKRVYGPSGAGISSEVRPIPSGIDDGPVGVVWIGPGSTSGGNAEDVVVDVSLDYWVQADSAGYAYKTIAALPDLVRAAFRYDMDLGGQADRCIFMGWDAPQAEEVNGRYYLVLPCRLDLRLSRYLSDATA
ncbi:MAG TPA: hypothetical protein VMW94_10995 [Actinomycetes bacterium]|nr:hypothetical protein [Actinomycetes bacterium]